MSRKPAPGRGKVERSSTLVVPVGERRDDEIERSNGTEPIPFVELPRPPMTRSRTEVLPVDVERLRAPGEVPRTAELPDEVQRLALPFVAPTSVAPEGHKLSLEQLAWLRVALAVAPDERAHLLETVALDPSEHEAEEQRWRARFQVDPSLVGAFEGLVREAWSRT